MLQLTYTGPDALAWREAPAPRLARWCARWRLPRATSTHSCGECRACRQGRTSNCSAVAPPLAEHPGAEVLVVGGAGAGSIGLYAAGVAVALGSESVLYVDADESRRQTADAAFA